MAFEGAAYISQERAINFHTGSQLPREPLFPTNMKSDEFPCRHLYITQITVIGSYDVFIWCLGYSPTQTYGAWTNMADNYKGKGGGGGGGGCGERGSGS